MKERGDGRIFSRKGSAFLWIAYYCRGKEHRESTGTSDPEKARKFLKRRLRQVGADKERMGKFIGPQQERVKVSKILDDLEANYQLRSKESPQFRSKLKAVRAYFGSWRAVEVTAAAVDKFIQEQKRAGKTDATINRYTQLLAQAFKLAVERNELSAAPTIQHLSEKGNARQGFFNDVEFQTLVDHLPKYLRDFAEFGYRTGWRKGEIASLRWEDVDGDVIRLRGENSKNGEPRTLTLEGELEELIERRKADRQVKAGDNVMLAAFVFHNEGLPVGDFRKAWATASVASGLGRFRCDRCKKDIDGHSCRDCGTQSTYIGRLFHDFRRTAVRDMVRAGVSEKVAMTISGHKTRSIFDRYNIVNEADLRSALQRTQNYRRETAEQQKGPAVMRRAGAGI